MPQPNVNAMDLPFGDDFGTCAPSFSSSHMNLPVDILATSSVSSSSSSCIDSIRGASCMGRVRNEWKETVCRARGGEEWREWRENMEGPGEPTTVLPDLLEEENLPVSPSYCNFSDQLIEPWESENRDVWSEFPPASLGSSWGSSEMDLLGLEPAGYPYQNAEGIAQTPTLAQLNADDSQPFLEPPDISRLLPATLPDLSPARPTCPQSPVSRQSVKLPSPLSPLLPAPSCRSESSRSRPAVTLGPRKLARRAEAVNTAPVRMVVVKAVGGWEVLRHRRGAEKGEKCSSEPVYKEAEHNYSLFCAGGGTVRTGDMDRQGVGDVVPSIRGTGGPREVKPAGFDDLEYDEGFGSDREASDDEEEDEEEEEEEEDDYDEEEGDEDAEEEKDPDEDEEAEDDVDEDDLEDKEDEEEDEDAKNYLSDIGLEPGFHNDMEEEGEDENSKGDKSCSGAEDTEKRRSQKWRFFWEYGEHHVPPEGQAKRSGRFGAQGGREWDRHTLPSNQCQSNVKRGTKRCRRSIVEDVTPSPRKLLQIGNELQQLNHQIGELTPVCELPLPARPRLRKEKNKLASRACRLKKKAQHEANKVKLCGLNAEHERLLRVLRSIKADIVQRVQQPDNGDEESMSAKLQKHVACSLGPMIASHTPEFVNRVLEATAAGDPWGSLNLTQASPSGD
uniref:CREB3 regulatory factor n=1 Tax=Myxine glutinosa TaxID=7769 RepID=UPI00358F4460